jgi:hypothetical protein
LGSGVRMKIVAELLTWLVYAPFYLPVYLPFLISLNVRSKGWLEVRRSLQAASFAMFLVALLRPGRPHSPRPNFGDDVAGNIRGSEYHMAHDYWPDLFWEIGWIWGGGLLCTSLAVGIGCYLRTRRLRRQHQFA